ncbi:diaminopimelate decarboxylase [Zavarzinia sp. CC-PAN008]|uniref:diaminopimelate decarboxylase n=1 Tax=Zavarzinia sp. CC-PAN008 TaxID=3243332 RepID=UPI003F742EAA
MQPFAWRQGTLHAEDVSVAAIAAEVGTPFYCYSTAKLEAQYLDFAGSLTGLDTIVCYSVKANSNQAVLATLARLGAGADVVSAGEMMRALQAGIPAGRIVFSGVGKTAAELDAALAAGIYQFNVESIPELHALSARAVAGGHTAPVALRVNPDVDAGTHDKISTGREHDKFGIAWADVPGTYAAAAALPGLDVAGVDIHIGSQLTSLDPLATAFGRVADLVRSLRDAGHRIDRIDLGGGLGVDYGNLKASPPRAADYGALARRIVGNLGCTLLFEPGRRIVAEAGILVAAVTYVKESAGRQFVILDAAMNDLMRPALYDSHHEIVPVAQPDKGVALLPVDVVGPVCESTDSFAKDRPLPPLKAGDLVAFQTAGAYGAVMSGTYNTRPLVPEVLVSGHRFAIVRRRMEVADILALDSVPSWVGDASDERRGAAE